MSIHPVTPLSSSLELDPPFRKDQSLDFTRLHAGPRRELRKADGHGRVRTQPLSLGGAAPSYLKSVTLRISLVPSESVYSNRPASSQANLSVGTLL